MRARLLVSLLVTMLCVAVAGSSHSQSVPTTFTYQGKLATPDGKPLPDDRYGVLFSLYTTQTGGTAFWTQETAVVTSRGIFAVELGPLQASDLARAEIWLETRVSGQEPFPRQRINAVPYAMRAGDLKLPFSGTVSYFNPAFSVDQTGTGSCGVFTIHNPASAGYGLYAYTNGTGSAFVASSPGTGDTAKFEKSGGTGNAASFSATGSSNPGSAILAYSNGTGPVIKATTDYTGNAAGYFRIEHAQSTQPALYAESWGTGYGIYARTGTSATAIRAESAGSGPAIRATAGYGGSAISATSSGTGVTASIASTNSQAPNPVMTVANASGGTNNTLEVTQNGLIGAGVKATATNSAVAGMFYALNESGGDGAPALYASSSRPYGPALIATSNAPSNRIAARFEGEVEVSGELHVGSDGVGMPLGYAFFNSAGTRMTGTSNLSCTRITGANGYVEYQVHIDGQPFSEGSHAVLITPLTSSSAVVAHCWAFNGDIRIEFRYLSGGAQAYSGFSILIYGNACPTCMGQ